MKLILTKVFNSINLASMVLPFFIFSNSVFSQKVEPSRRVTEPDHVIASTIMARDYELYISFPSTYSTKDTISYPVLYVLDGLQVFDMIRGMQRVLSFSNEIEDVIIVGIGSGIDLPSWVLNRSYDYTTSIDTASQNSTEQRFGFPKGSVKSGGAKDFLECIKTEIIPFVDKNYKTNSDRGLAGHSLGGLFTAFCLIHSDGYFTRFAISSPSLWWDNEGLLNQAIFQFTTRQSWDIPPTKVFISVGDKEGPNMVSTMVKFSSWLGSIDYGNIDLDWQIFNEETHLSMWAINLSKTLGTLYGKR